MCYHTAMRILDRYVLGELLVPFLFGVIGFILVMLSVSLYQFTDLIFMAGAPVGDVVQLLLYSLPSIVVLTFPVAYLFASLLGIGRMTKDFEIIALRGSGVSFRRIIVPILAGAALVSLGNFAFNERVVPFANREVSRIKQDLASRVTKPLIRPNVFFKGTENRYFYVRQVDPRTGDMRDVFVLDQTQIGPPQVIRARRARWMNLGQGRSLWQLEDGTLHKYAEDGHVQHELAFGKMAIQFSLATSTSFGGDVNPSEQSSSDLQKQISGIKKSGGDAKAAEVALLMKYALPLASFFAALIAAPLGLLFSRMGAYIGVGLSIILVFLYYVIMQTFQAMGNAGIVPPILGAWTQNLIFGVIGAFLLWRVDRR
ncbi:MAG: LptF/LptG family permease [bacterium]|nr:LptF/LptG family permease [bacterium]